MYPFVFHHHLHRIELQKQEKRRQEAMMKKILLGIKNRLARLAFTAWHEAAAASARRKGLVSRAAMHWFKRALSSSFRTWEDMASVVCALVLRLRRVWKGAARVGFKGALVWCARARVWCFSITTDISHIYYPS